MDGLAQELGYVVMGLAMLAGAIAMAARYPVVFKAFQILFFVTWGLATVGLTLFALFYLPRHGHGNAIRTLIGGLILGIPWFRIGLPALLDLCKNK